MFTGALKLKLSLLFLIVIQAGSVQGQSRPEDLKLLFSGLEQVSRLNKSSLGFCPKVEKRTAVCPDFVFRFLKDSQDSKSADLLKSQMNTCYSQFDSQGRQIKNPSVVNQPQWLHEIIKKTNLNELGELANSVGESCAGHFKAHPADYSRFYYATAKLNEAAQVTSKEIVQIQNLLKEPIDQVACPDPIVLQKAHESCEKEKKCPQNQTLSQLALESMRDLETFKKSKKTLEALSSNCKGAGSCQQDVERLSDLVGALILKNPWFLDSDFLSGERYSANYRLSQYFKKRKKHLFQHQSELEKASRCFQFENAENCQVRNIRELLEMSPDLEIKGVSAQEKNKIENLFNFQACQDRVSLERDRTADVVNAPAQALLGMGTQVGTEGILEKIALGRFRSVESAAKIIIPRLSGLFASESALHLMTESSALANIKKSCLDKKVNLQQSQASAGSQKKCSTEESAFGAGQFDESSCMVDLALAAVAASPALGADLAFKKMIGTSRSTNILVDRRAPGAFANRNTNTSRLDQPTNIYLTRSGIDSYMYRRFPTINNRPTSIEIVEVTKVDGRKAYMYTTVDRLKDGTWVRTANEFQMDPITGAIDATSPAGKDLFERMAKAHSGKAHYAFFDVARLGFVNNNFKNLSQDGDLYLKGVADMIQKQGQGKVTLARTGGDEFGLIIHESDPEQVKKILADIRNAIRDDRQGLARKVFV
ncbi:MAG: diguanylate cyclase domain-containing protein, partial [Bdellovibrionales bacterium]